MSWFIKWVKPGLVRLVWVAVLVFWLEWWLGFTFNDALGVGLAFLFAILYSELYTDRTNAKREAEEMRKGLDSIIRANRITNDYRDHGERITLSADEPGTE